MANAATLTDFSSVAIPGSENAMSRRYLRILMRWIPFGRQHYEEWPGRPNCGHFFGGVLWYGQDTAMPILALAAAASSTEYEAGLTGMSREEARLTALKGLRYLCFTHDTGPADCVRPKDKWGREGLSETKWGERGRGFFPESQCGVVIACMAMTAALIRDILDDDVKHGLAAIAADYLDRFGSVEPKAGVYSNTQTEENAWTALGLMSCLVLLPGHARHDELVTHARRWLFRTATRPEDRFDHAHFADGKTVAECCGPTFTTLPDGTAENHGFVHPSYMAASVGSSGALQALLHLYGESIPPEAFWHRADTYAILKSWCDRTGQPHCVQGMDWPYFNHAALCSLHTVANVFLEDPDAALLERRVLAILEHSTQAHGGRLVPEEQARLCRGQQDPALVRERMIVRVAMSHLAHRLMAGGVDPSEESDFEERMRGVTVYPHGGALLHRHGKGQTSLAWRNRSMVLPCTREGIRLIGPGGGMLARLSVRGKACSVRPGSLVIRESSDRVCALVVEHLFEGCIDRELFFASMGDGKCVVMERLVAREDVVIDDVRQGCMNIVNDGLFADSPDLKGHRRVFWEGGQKDFEGYAAGPDDDATVHEFGKTSWVNIDDRCGLVFRGTGRAVYTNRHHFEVWRAIEDELVLSLHDRPRPCGCGETVAELSALWCPEQAQDETACQGFRVGWVGRQAFFAEVDGIVCACNFGRDPVDFPVGAVGGREPAIIERG